MMEIEMGLQCTPKTFNETSNIEVGINFIGSSLLSESYNSQAVAWSGDNISKTAHHTLPLYNSQAIAWSSDDVSGVAYHTLPSSINFYTVSTTPTWAIIKGTNCNLSSEPPLIFLVSEEAEKFLSENTHLEKEVFDVCGKVAEFVMDNDLTAIGEISIFQEDELEPKLFIKYAIGNKEYSEILKLWDKACEKIATSISVNSLEKIAVIFDQI